jgi:hypothetical protein
MEKILNYLKKFSFGAYRTGLYKNGEITFSSIFSFIFSVLFLLGLLTGIGIYFNEIFIEKQ